MKNARKGFTLVELTIVMVIIGLLIAGILKGQELINSGKVKALAADFRNIPTAYYAYQDKFHAIPGDDAAVVAHLGAAATLATTPASKIGNGILDGAFDSVTATDDSILFWQHVRLAGLLPGSTTVGVAAGDPYLPVNAFGGRVGIASTSPISDANFTGNFYLCSAGIPGKLAKQLDITLDDGATNAGSVRLTAAGTGAVPAASVATADVVDGTLYTVCMSY